MDEFDQNRCEEEHQKIKISSSDDQDVNEELEPSQLTEVRTESQLVEDAPPSSWSGELSKTDQREGAADLTTSQNQDGVVSVSVTAQISEADTKTMPEQKHSPLNINNGSIIAANKQTSSNISPISVVKSPVSDGFNWRKYGQKQVKSPQGSRSYYKCTHSDCFAKKIECSDLTGNVVEIVNKGLHSHDPPSNYNNSSRDKSTSSTSTVFTEQPIKMLTDHDQPVSSKEPAKEMSILVSEKKRPTSAVSDGNSESQAKEKQSGEPEPKKRLKKCNSETSSELSKPGKKPKFVVHAAGDVGISGDGYRWRKYGQKMVKGNPHPRNYYRCTSAGCPVRKHIETDVDNTSAIIITYKGIHDHDMPVPKKRHGPPSVPLLTAAAPVSKNNKKIENQKTQWSVDKEGELTGEPTTTELGSEKVFESARTLLSIGFEIKPC